VNLLKSLSKISIRSNVSEESASSNNKGGSLTNVDQDGTPSSTAPRTGAETRIVSKSHNLVNAASYKNLTKKRKIGSPETDIQITNNETASSLGDASGGVTRAGVFDRLANKNYTKILKAQRKENKDQPINFFDTQYHQPCLSKILLLFGQCINFQKDLLDVVFTNGKRIKEYLAETQTTAEKISRSLYHDQHFIICKKISEEYENINCE